MLRSRPFLEDTPCSWSPPPRPRRKSTSPAPTTRSSWAPEPREAWPPTCSPPPASRSSCSRRASSSTSNAELKSMEWPYDHPRRGEMPYDRHALGQNEYTFRPPPYAPKDSPYSKVHSYVQGWGGTRLLARTSWWTRRSTPTPVRSYAWVRSRAVGGKTNIWGRLALRLSDYDFKAKSRDGYGEDWPISYADLQPYYDKVDLYLGIAGHPEGLRLPAGQHLPAHDAPQSGRGATAGIPREERPRAHALPGRSDHRRAEAQQVPIALLRPGRVRPARRRLRHPCRLRLPHRAHLPGPGHGPAHATPERDRAGGDARSGHGSRFGRRLRRYRLRPDPRPRRGGWWCWQLPRSSRRASCCSPAARSTRTASATPAATSATTSAST